MEEINLELSEQELKDLFCHLIDHLQTKGDPALYVVDSNLFDIKEKIFEKIMEVDPKFFKTIPPFAVDYFNNLN